MKDSLAPYIELSRLQPSISISELETFCATALQQGLAAVCVPPILVKKAKEFLKDSPVKVATVAGFPFGYSAVEAKLAEVVMAVIDGADEINLVINITALKNNDWQYLAGELNAILPVVRSKQRALKINLEAGLLSDDELVKCCDLYGISGVEFIETATGYGEQPARIEQVKWIRAHLAEAVKIKATGTFASAAIAREWIEAGADRLGCFDIEAIETE